MGNTGCKYLYGAAVQGVQEYIMRRSKLKEICIADAKVSLIRTREFDEFIKDKDVKIIENGAGKIKVLFHDKVDCENTVRHFQKKIMQFAPGVILSQAVIEIPENAKCTIENIKELEDKLKAQRNRAVRPMTIGLMGIERKKETGIPEYNEEKEDDWKQYVELSKKFFADDIKEQQITREFSSLVGEDSWIAVVHIDGNRLTQIVQDIMVSDFTGLRKFDHIMDRVMKGAAREAYKAVGDNKMKAGGSIPIRPIVMGGDDLTVVCRADLALDYAETFCKSFEKLTKEEFKVGTFSLEYLTSCAGIAFTKAKFPYYFAYKLADELCAVAKKDAKSINEECPPSCIMFHKVQDSFTEDFADIVKRELTIVGHNKNESFLYGPYYINEQSKRWTVKTFKENVEKLREKNSIKNGLREWTAMKLSSNQSVVQYINRLKQMVSEQDQKIIDQAIEIRDGSYPTYDLLSYCSIIKNVEENGI